MTTGEDGNLRARRQARWSVLALVAALVLVVGLTLLLLERPPAFDRVPARTSAAGRDQVQALLQRGRAAYDERGDRRQASALLQRAFELDPDNAEVLEALGQMALVDGRALAARDLFIRAAVRQPGLPRNHADLAVAFLCLNELKDAENKAAQGYRRFPEQRHEFALILACIYQRLQQADETKRYLTEAHQALGPELAKAVERRHWARALRDSAVYQELLGAAPAGQPAAPEPPPVPPAAP